MKDSQCVGEDNGDQVCGDGDGGDEDRKGADQYDEDTCDRIRKGDDLEASSR